MRQLPPSLVAIKEGSGLWYTHEALARRAETLALSEAFSYAELTSTLFSQTCLYRDILPDSQPIGPISELAGVSIDGEGINPRRGDLLASWVILGKTWQEAATAAKAKSGGDGRFSVVEKPEDPRSLRQAAILSRIFPDLGSWPAASSETDDTRDNLGRPQGRSLPVAIELLEMIEDIGHTEKPHGPLWEGPVEVHVAAGDLCFCLMPEDAYFQRLSSAASFLEVGRVQKFLPVSKSESGGDSTVDSRSLEQTYVDEGDLEIVSQAAAELELCLENAVELWLLRRCGWHVVPLSCRLWRRLGTDGKRNLVARSLRPTSADGLSTHAAASSIRAAA